MTTTDPSAIKRAVELLGSQLALAKALGVTPVTVNQWVRPSGANSSRPVPPKQCVRIEVLTSGLVSRRDLRPADWQDIWPELATKEAV
jgi:DNA-binding transcriptional regulator YdaS (Cro superfamily)